MRNARLQKRVDVHTMWVHSWKAIKMKVDIIPIGNSRGIRIPKALLEQCGFGNSVDIQVENDRLVLNRTAEVRRGWEDAFKAMAFRRDDGLLETPATTFDEDEWKW
jgi:antitoxin MazE